MIKQLKKRSEVKEEYKWKIEDLYENIQQWQKEADEILSMAEELKGYKGKLGESADTLYSYLSLRDKLNLFMERVYVYANQKFHEDTTNGIYQDLSDKAASIMAKVNSAISFATPEILEIPEQKIEAFYKEKTELLQYQRMIQEIMKDKPHTLSSEMEELLAQTAELADGPENAFSMFNNADIKFPVIENEDGKEIEITHGRYSKLMESGKRSVRKDAFEGMYSSYKKFKNTLASLYSTNVKKDIFYSRARNYPSSLECALDGSRIPVEVYYNLIDAVHENLPAMYKYMKLRKKALKVDELHMYDIYTPIVSDFKMEVAFEEAKQIVKEGLKPLGAEYLSILQEGFDSGWIDVYENEGKRSGAYSWGAYGTHPYVLLNFQNTLNNTFTLAHEMGHAIHSYYSDKTQPITYAGYRIFVAEVASTCNEALLMAHLIANAKDRKEKAYLINYHLEQFRSTLYRQTMFAEFEMLTHQMAEEGQALTAENLSAAYYDLNKKYYGDEVVIDEDIAMEWARIPHFYRSFYVYQYATGYSAAIALSKRILEKGELAVEEYIHNFLCGGSSKDPIDLLKGAGVDMSSKEPVKQALMVFADLVDQLEGLID
ncbi:oligoendopeptidase F [[Clostridium] polysaccharolyticum]|uniref:Oligopeptidase F n=1 Tax=[Clostridium] polysaccharolyticum TaxID=29364 RepID=A0A1I0B1X8_9FIRM|nr:oligoendopeptidase F [[Clostridium] polysaccharolyticum]SES99946.1 oligoendopeptidase F [[Clostridium] polysaccharolyticum]